MTATETIVVFRVWRGKDGGDVIALFPCVPATNFDHTCQSYMHVGQHGAADYAGVIRETRPAMPAEYADLKRELEHYGPPGEGYVLDVRARAPHNAYDLLRAQQAEWRAA